MNGAEHLCQVLREQGIRHIFGLPGTQNTHLFSALRRAPIEAFVTTHEMSAGFAALGYAATGNQPAVMAIIGGPGLTYALTPLQEARLDSIPIVCLVFAREHDPKKSFHTQQIDHRGIAGSVCKDVLEVLSLEQFASTFGRAVATASEGEPGPVVILVKSQLLDERIESSMPQISAPNEALLDTKIVDDVLSRLNRKSVLLLAGRGCLPCASDLVRLAERLGAPVLTSTSARGVIPEDHDLAIRSDLVPCKLINQFIAQFDCVLALGIRFSENSSRGFRLDIPPEKLVHIDQGENIVGRNFDAQIRCVANVPTFITALLETNLEPTTLDIRTLEDWRSRFRASLATDYEPKFQGLKPPTAERFFEVLGSILPNDSILVTDSGNHQMLARKHYVCRSANGLLLPTNFQSMGFAASAAMGAKLAQPNRQVVALLGDGGFQMSGLELAAAVRAKLNMIVIVFNDGHFGLIRNAQLGHDGFESGVALPHLDIAGFAESISLDYVHAPSDLASAIKSAMRRNGPTVIEINLGDTAAIRKRQAKSRAKDALKRTFGQSFIDFLKRF